MVEITLSQANDRIKEQSTAILIQEKISWVNVKQSRLCVMLC
jgi:hypothetical protein